MTVEGELVNRRIGGLGAISMGVFFLYIFVGGNADRAHEIPYPIAGVATLSSYALLIGLRLLLLPNDRKQLYSRWGWAFISFLFFLGAIATYFKLGLGPAGLPLAASVLMLMYAIGLLQFLDFLLSYDE